MLENSHLYCMLCTKTFVPYSVLNNNEFKQSSENQSNLLIQQNQESLILRTSLKLLIAKTTLLYFTIKDLNSTFNDIDSPLSLFHLNIYSLSFHFGELESLISKSKNNFQIIFISETRLKKTLERTTNIQLENFNIKQVPTESANGRVLLYIHACNIVTSMTNI